MRDERDDRGYSWLTGSQQYKMMKNVHEILAETVEISQPTATEWLSIIQESIHLNDKKYYPYPNQFQ